MLLSRLIKVILVLLGISYIILEVLKHEVSASVVAATMFILLTYLYHITTFDKRRYFLLFLIAFSLGKILEAYTYVFVDVNSEPDYGYYISNGLYMLSYTFLIIQCISSMNMKVVLSKFFVTIAILIVLGVFCVTLITETTQSIFNFSEYLLEFVYNAIIMILLSLSLINYMYRDSKKAILFFIASMFIFFSEMIQMAYYYIAELEFLAAIYSVFLVSAFAIFYVQSQLKLEAPRASYFENQLHS